MKTSSEIQRASARPLVSIILAVRNEARFIRSAIESLLKQEATDFDFEILAVDGKSSDGTTGIIDEIVQADSRVRLLVNERIKTPFAFNLGLREARGEYVCILGSHARYERDYVAVCLQELTHHGAVGCSGQLITRPGNSSFQARLVAWAVGHWFGSSSRSVRTSPEGFVDTIPYPLFVKQAVLDVGAYDERLHRNQDNDLNQKLRARGQKLYLTGKTRAEYFAKPTLTSLLRYAFQSGFWNAISLRRNTSSMSVRHFVPLAFVLVLILGIAAIPMAALFLPRYQSAWLFYPLIGILGLHLMLGLLAGIEIGISERSAGALLLPLVFLSFHFSYGTGSLCGLLGGSRAGDRGFSGESVGKQMQSAGATGQETEMSATMPIPLATDDGHFHTHSRSQPAGVGKE